MKPSEGRSPYLHTACEKPHRLHFLIHIQLRQSTTILGAVAFARQIAAGLVRQLGRAVDDR